MRWRSSRCSDSDAHVASETVVVAEFVDRVQYRAVQRIGGLAALDAAITSSVRPTSLPIRTW